MAKTKSGKNKITDTLFNDAVKLINSGSSVRSTCEQLNIPRTSFRRMLEAKGGVDLKNDIEYSILLKTNNVVFIINGDFYPINYDSLEYEKKKKLIVELCNRDKFMMNLDEQGKIIDGNLNSTVRHIVEQMDDFQIKEGKFYYKGRELDADFFKVLKKVSKNKNSNLMKFADNLIENPDPSMVMQLYGFIQHNDIEIDEEGFVIAYKAVRLDYLDYYSRTYNNRVGEVVKMNRNDVDADPDVTCSHGLHVGSMSYITQMYNISNGRLVVCRVNPKDFCSIPVDYEYAKARVCEYTVIDEIQN